MSYWVPNRYFHIISPSKIPNRCKCVEAEFNLKYTGVYSAIFSYVYLFNFPLRNYRDATETTTRLLFIIRTLIIQSDGVCMTIW